MGKCRMSPGKILLLWRQTVCSVSRFLHSPAYPPTPYAASLPWERRGPMLGIPATCAHSDTHLCCLAISRNSLQKHLSNASFIFLRPNTLHNIFPSRPSSFRIPGIIKWTNGYIAAPLGDPIRTRQHLSQLPELGRAQSSWKPVVFKPSSI